jgi:hypothetical protein
MTDMLLAGFPVEGKTTSHAGCIRTYVADQRTGHDSHSENPLQPGHAASRRNAVISPTISRI